MRRYLTLGLCLSLAGCLSWDEAPEDATGFLIVENEQLKGNIRGTDIDPGTATASGYCTAEGWQLTLTATAGGQEINSEMQVWALDLDKGDVAVHFVQSGAADTLDVQNDRVAGHMKSRVCVGDLDNPEMEIFADDVELDVTPTGRDGDLDVKFVAHFPKGDTIEGQFSMEMPVID